MEVITAYPRMLCQCFQIWRFLRIRNESTRFRNDRGILFRESWLILLSNSCVLMSNSAATKAHSLLGGIQKLNVDEVFFNDLASPTVDEAVQRLEEIQIAVRH